MTPDRSPAEHVRATLPQKPPLTAEDRAWAVEVAVSHVENRSVERAILAAPDTVQAVQAAKQGCSHFGQSGSDGLVDGLLGRGRGIHVARGGREGLVTWRELVAAVRTETLF